MKKKLKSYEGKVIQPEQRRLLTGILTTDFSSKQKQHDQQNKLKKEKVALKRIASDVQEKIAPNRKLKRATTVQEPMFNSPIINKNRKTLLKQKTIQATDHHSPFSLQTK